MFLSSFRRWVAANLSKPRRRMRKAAPSFRAEALESRILLAAEPLLIDFGQTGAASTYATLSSAYVAGSTITTPAHQNGLAGSDNTFNNVGTADIASGMVWGDGSAASGVSLAFGRATTAGGTINYSDSSNLSLVTASPTTSNDEFDSALFKGAIANTSQQAGEEAVAITGLPAGSYDVFVINNAISALGEMCNDQIGTNVTAYNATLAQMQGPLDFDGTFTSPGDFVAGTVVVNAGDKLDVVTHGCGNNAGYQKFNLLEVVPTSLLTSSGAQVVPQTAVHRGAAVPTYLNAFNQWTANNTTWASDAEAYGNWSQIDDATWLYSAWEPWVAAQTGRRLVVSIPMLPSSGGNLAQGAAGNFTSGATNYFQTLAQNLVNYGLGNSIIRLGWEFNGNWYPWYAGENSGDSGPTGNFVNYWRLIVTDMRTTAPNLKFDWNPSMGVNNVASEPEYPGNAYVDYIGVDAYDASWATGTYPFPTNDSAADIELRQEIACNGYMNETEGLLYWSQFAASQGKPLSFPEWGVWDRPDGHGGLDDPYFIHMLKSFMANPANNVAFESYFDVGASDGNSQLSPGPTGTQPLEFPNATMAYQTLFSGTNNVLNTNADIGSPALAGSGIYTDDDNTWTLTGSGTGIGGASDQFHLTSQSITGDQVLAARVTSVSSSISGAAGGLMMRDGTGAAAAYVDVTVSPGAGIVFQYRTEAGVVSSAVAAWSYSAAVWLRLMRTGNVFTAYYATSTNTPGPSDWIAIASISIAFVNSNYQAGLVVTSGNSTLIATATFDNLTFQSEPLPTGWTNADIGSPAAAGSATYVLTGYSQAGGGAGIGGTSDQFNYTYQSAAKDEVLVARMDGVVSTVSTAGAGLMFRDTTAANAINVLLDVQPTGGISFSYRVTTGGATTTVATVQATTPTLAAPIWIKLARSGSTVTAWYSTGTATPTNWTQVGSAITTAMNATSYLAGLAATAYNSSGALGTGVFHSVGMAVDPMGHKMAISLTGTTKNYIMVDTAAADILWVDGYTSIQGQAEFNVVDAGNGDIALKSVQTGFYLRYDPTDGSLRADQDTTIGSDDIFQWIVADDSGDIALESMASGTYMIYDWGTSIMGNQAATFNSQTEFTPTTLVAAPTVTQISPATGTYQGGTSVVITGTDFTGATAVSFGSTVLPSTSFIVNSPTQITAVSPAGTAGVVDVTVTTASGKSATSSADKFTYSSLPGWLALSSQATWNSSTQTLTATGNTTINADPGVAGNSPIINAGGNASIVVNTGGNGANVNFGSLTLTGNARLDVQNNVVLVANTTTDPVSTIQSYIFGGQIKSSSVIAGANYGIGYGTVTVGNTTETKFRYDIKGDTNLDGTANNTDLTTVLQNLGLSTTLWSLGNFEYTAASPSLNTTVNNSDLTDVLQNLGLALPLAVGVISAGTVSTVQLNATVAAATPVPTAAVQSAVAAPLVAITIPASNQANALTVAVAVAAARVPTTAAPVFAVAAMPATLAATIADAAIGADELYLGVSYQPVFQQ